MKQSRADEAVNRHYGSLFGGLLDFHAGLLAHGSQDNDVCKDISSRTYTERQKALTAVLALLVEHLVNSVTNFTLGNLDIVLSGTGLVHQGKETIVGDVELAGAISSMK